jgi:hypothetical protein
MRSIRQYQRKMSLKNVPDWLSILARRFHRDMQIVRTSGHQNTSSSSARPAILRLIPADDAAEPAGPLGGPDGDEHYISGT